MRSREQHLAWAKRRALEYLDAGDAPTAVTSMMSDLNKHTGTADIHPIIVAFGLLAAKDNDSDNARRFIEGFR